MGGVGTDAFGLAPLVSAIDATVDLIVAVAERFPGNPDVALEIDGGARRGIDGEMFGEMKLRAECQIGVDTAADYIVISVAARAPEDPGAAVGGGDRGGFPVDSVAGAEDDGIGPLVALPVTREDLVSTDVVFGKSDTSRVLETGGGPEEPLASPRVERLRGVAVIDGVQSFGSADEAGRVVFGDGGRIERGGRGEGWKGRHR